MKQAFRITSSTGDFVAAGSMDGVRNAPVETEIALLESATEASPRRRVVLTPAVSREPRRDAAIRRLDARGRQAAAERHDFRTGLR
jgi:hypothetical protein